MINQNNSGRVFGKFLGTEFKDGLAGGLFGGDTKSEAQTQIEGAFAALKGKLGEEESKLRERLTSDREQLKSLMAEQNKDWEQIGKVRTRIFDNRSILAKAKAGSNQLLKSLRDEKNSLVKLSKEYQNVSKSLEEAKGKLEELKSTQASAIQNYKDQYDQLPDIDSLVSDALSDAEMTDEDRAEARRKKEKAAQQRANIDQVALYKGALTKQIADTEKYMGILSQLRAAGLDDRTYKKLLEKGTAGTEFASQLLAKGADGIAQINKLDADLAKVSTSIAQKAGFDLYQAGINAAQGLVNGLQQKQSVIQKAMQHLADGMVWALKRRLGIRSPSKIFAALGQNSGQGLADGLSNSSKLVQDAATGVGDGAATALTNSLANVSNLVLDSIDSQPTVTPVLDLTQFQKDASTMQDLTNVVPITAAASYGQASAISQQSQADDSALADSTQPVSQFTFEQNITSPKALDDVEIYRQTRNQLSQVKSALGVTT
jgi:archaellum component FlaC